MRINARISEEDTAKIRFLARKMGLPISSIVRDAIRTLYERCTTDASEPSKILAESGFIGCATDDKALSRDYKTHLIGLLEKKHGHR